MMALARRSIDITQVVEWNSGVARRLQDCLAGEEPLEMRSGRRSLGTTLRTPGHDAELVAGFLFTEGIISRPEQLLSLKTAENSRGLRKTDLNRAYVRLARGVRISEGFLSRRFSAGSACGLCGKASINNIRRRGAARLKISGRCDPEVLCQLPGALKAAQLIFGRTGGLHAAALFNFQGELLVLQEDIGRHNAVDKVIGWALLHGRLPLSDHVVLVSGRGGFEIVQKSIVAGAPILASVSAPSSLAVQLAREMGMTLVGFLRGNRFVIYSGEERLGVDVSAADLNL